MLSRFKNKSNVAVKFRSSGDIHTFSKQVLYNGFQSLEALFSFRLGPYVFNQGGRCSCFIRREKVGGVTCFLADCMYKRLHFITHWVRWSMCTRGYFRAMSSLAMRNLGKVVVPMVKLRHTCFYFLLSNSLIFFFFDQLAQMWARRGQGRKEV